MLVVKSMRALGVWSRLPRSTLEGESRRGRLSGSFESRSKAGKQVLKQWPPSPMLLVGALVAAATIFLLTRVSLHSHFSIGRHHVSTRARVRPDACSVEVPDAGVIETDTGSTAPSWRIEGLPLQLRIGLVNIPKEGEEAKAWKEYAGGTSSSLHFPVGKVNESLQWSDFFPEWIDEEEEYGIQPECPPLPFPCVRGDIKTLDLVVARVPCSDGQERNVQRLQLLLAAATVATRSSGDEKLMHVLVGSQCRPALNLFPCEELLKREGHWWLFRVDVARMRERLALPVGSCELSLSTHWPEQLAVETGNERREAYVSMVHTDASYVCGAIVLAHSLRLSGTTRDLVMLVDATIPVEKRQALQEAGWQVRLIERIRNPHARKDRYNEWNYSKFRLWQLTHYDKIVFIDSDLLVHRNIDFLFRLPEISATGNDENRFNSGVMVIEPSNCTFHILMDQIAETRSYNGGDQGYLNEIFPWWHRIPKHLNFLKFFWSNETKEYEDKTELFRADPPVLYVTHYLGLKPWVCFRDYDCNWNVQGQRAYASDVAHASWYRIHDTMPVSLQRHCWLRTLAKAAREAERRIAQAANFPDQHWNIPIRDPRLQFCDSTPEVLCDWQEMLLHWDEPLPSNASSHTDTTTVR